MRRTVAALVAMLLGMLLSPAVAELVAQDSVCVDVQQGPPGLRGLHCGADEAGTVERLQATIDSLRAARADTVFVTEVDTVLVERVDTLVVRDTVLQVDTVFVELPPDTVFATDTVVVESPPDTVVVTDTVEVQLPPDTVLITDTVFVTDTVQADCPECPAEDTTVVEPEPEPEPEPALSDTLVQATAHDSLSWTAPLRGASISAADGWTREADGQLVAETGPRLLRFLALDPGLEPVVDSVTWALDTLVRRDRAPPWEFSPTPFAVFSLPDGPHELAVTYHLHDGSEQAIASGFAVAGVGDAAPTKPSLDLAASVDSLRLNVTAAGDSIGMATVTLTGTDVEGARGYLWAGGRDDADGFEWRTVTEAPLLRANFREGQWWTCVEPYNTRGTFGRRCNSFEVGRP